MKLATDAHNSLWSTEFVLFDTTGIKGPNMS